MSLNCNLKCNRCSECNGKGCPDELPGLGGVYGGEIFQKNYEGWHILYEKAKENNILDYIKSIPVSPNQIGCGPVTGAVENIGYFNENSFYYPYISNADNAGFQICVGDGYPDEKLRFGIDAVNNLQSKNKAAFFLKPYSLEKLTERIKWVLPYSSYIGVDIDAYNIATMRKLVNLEKKNAKQLNIFRKISNKPLIIKGIFTYEDLKLVEEVKPEVVYISNHGGRVNTRIDSTADFLVRYGSFLKKYSNELWIDGGIRKKIDIQTALYYGADKVILGRPLIIATVDDNYSETVSNLLN